MRRPQRSAFDRECMRAERQRSGQRDFECVGVGSGPSPIVRTVQSVSGQVSTTPCFPRSMVTCSMAGVLAAAIDDDAGSSRVPRHGHRFDAGRDPVRSPRPDRAGRVVGALQARRQRGTYRQQRVIGDRVGVTVDAAPLALDSELGRELVQCGHRSDGSVSRFSVAEPASSVATP